ncbi:TPA: homoserine kinase [Streptococcus suis]|uniref:homoserine kinase n=1 Tax=Streptococcus parasuis TaxID=1501662 RepID=UPI0004233C12|nr:homoserine kinase [Streptococcus parasuis]NQP36308.1 homoserine kinase [Streptococcus suis]MDG4478314.1 homoserine kinase [Streptococcus parasuis]NQQ99662.1 homoserine kinase [Streptococcus suis]HEL1556509.1 homoserine kinase [Streptococcus suis]HEM3177780.1 homoserine kinase [Streptococcus suis]
MKIIVPATSANIGPGFDSVGVALSKYLAVEVLEPTNEWIVEHQLEHVPSDQNNLLIRTALTVAKNLQPHRLKMESDIPLARGLGSSSSVIVAGIELANQLGKLNLSQDEKLQLATKIEGHPDNVAPAIYGNLVISSYVNKKVQAVVTDFPPTSFVAFIPNYPLRTSESRGVLPSQMGYKKAVAASSIANVAIASLMSGDIEKAGQLIQLDLFHEPYRQLLVKEFCPIKQLAQEIGAYATYLSGAGPTVMVLAPAEKETKLIGAIEALQLDGSVHSLTVDTKGTQVIL